ncbi:thermonuclease family protein, partial [bacterium]|nr:thermonuclease family protein [bacterium]MBU4560854.1 thermonuclease family protein [bacterium]
EEPADHYGRTLALVYTNLSDAKKGPRYSLNAKLLQEGLAEVLFIPPSEFDPYSWK